jgi:predicted transglutaminase-like cysteine proteinase
MGLVTRGLVTALVAAATIFSSTADAQIIRMDGLRGLLATRDHEPFGLSTDLAPGGPLWVKWRQFEADFAGNIDEITRCRAEPESCSKGALTLVALIDEARGLDGRRQLAIVNRSLNLAIAYASDMSQHGVTDLWSSPLSTLERGRGDCEDYAIAKLFVLRAAGIAAADLRLLIAHNHSDGNAHAVLAVRRESRWLILDNRKLVLLDDTMVRDLEPLFALDLVGVHKFIAPAAVVAAASAQAAPASDNPGPTGDILPLLM